MKLFKLLRFIDEDTYVIVEDDSIVPSEIKYSGFVSNLKDNKDGMYSHLLDKKIKPCLPDTRLITIGDSQIISAYLRIFIC